MAIDYLVLRTQELVHFKSTFPNAFRRATLATLASLAHDAPPDAPLRVPLAKYRLA